MSKSIRPPIGSGCFVRLTVSAAHATNPPRRSSRETAKTMGGVRCASRDQESGRRKRGQTVRFVIDAAPARSDAANQHLSLLR